MADLRIYTEEELAFLRQLPDLPDELSLTPEQTSIVIGESLDWLRKKRQGSEGAGPPFEEHGNEKNIRYPLGGVRRWKRDRTFSTTREAKEARTYGRLSTFVGSGSLMDTETFRDGPDGRPRICDQGEPDSYSLSLDDFLARVRDAARNKALRDQVDEFGIAALPGAETMGHRGL
ncbi:hypothetical protein [uncultured Azonexus sp.]|uniref:hypothetical protein n=1 Tax=uncultured Azonexus sp. TaxID=520307 RepID=UPI0026396B60|nr:hypothetical protein [uncultured Azonexus sp.]